MALSRKATWLILGLGGLGGLVVAWTLFTAPGPGRSKGEGEATRRAGLDDSPPEVREFLERVLDELPEAGVGLSGYEFRHWEWPGKSTQEVLGIKAIPGVEPGAVIARVMDVDGYVGKLAHVETCRSLGDRTAGPTDRVRFYQRVSIPIIARVQQELVLVDAGTIRGYRVAYWYLLRPETEGLDRGDGARSAFNIGAWLAAPGVVGYALSAWPRRDDVNLLQWVALTTGADGLARRVVEGNIDGMADWAGATAGPAR